MIDLLRDPIWNGISGVIAIVAFIIAIQKDKINLISLREGSIKIISKAIIGALFLLPFIPLRFALLSIIRAGIPGLQSIWEGAIIPIIGVSGFLWGAFSYTFAAGWVSALISSTGKTFEQSTRRTIISVAVMLAFVDIYATIQSGTIVSDINTLVFNLVCDIAYGLAIGPILVHVVNYVDTAFSQSYSNKSAR